MSTQALVPTTPQTTAEFSAFGNITHFENAQRMAKALCSSQMVPETYRGEGNLGSCIIALEMANRIGANVMSVMQNLYIVHGKPAWSSQFLIACVNASGKFSPLRYTMTGKANTDAQGCIAWATDKSGERLESPEVTIGMAKAEGWFQKNGSKWKTMPELMLRYRAATLFSRLYAPELSLGIHTDDEVIDIVEVAPVVTEPVFGPKKEKKAKVESVPAIEVPPTTTEATPPVTVEATVEPVAAPLPPAEEPPVTSTLDRITALGITPEQVVKFYNANRSQDKAEANSIDDIPEQSWDRLLKPTMVARIKAVVV